MSRWETFTLLRRVRPDGLPLQIVLYVISRVVTSALPRSKFDGAPKSSIPPPPPSQKLTPPGYPYPKSRPPQSQVFRWYSALAWGTVMYAVSSVCPETVGLMHSNIATGGSFNIIENDCTVAWSPRCSIFTSTRRCGIVPETCYGVRSRLA